MFRSSRCLTLLPLLLVFNCVDASSGDSADSDKSDEQAARYACQAPANPDRGFASEFAIELHGDAPTSMTLVAGSQRKELGEVEEQTIDADSPALQATLGLFAEADVSGLADLSEVTRIVKFGTIDDSEVAVFQFFAADKQVGGSFFAQSLATRCLPRQDAPDSSSSDELKRQIEEAFAIDAFFEGFAEEITSEQVPESARAQWDTTWDRMQALVPDESEPIGYQFSLADSEETLFAIIIWDPNTMGANLEVFSERSSLAAAEIADDGTFEWK